MDKILYIKSVRLSKKPFLTEEEDKMFNQLAKMFIESEAGKIFFKSIHEIPNVFLGNKVVSVSNEYFFKVIDQTIDTLVSTSEFEKLLHNGYELFLEVIKFTSQKFRNSEDTFSMIQTEFINRLKEEIQKELKTRIRRNICQETTSKNSLLN